VIVALLVKAFAISIVGLAASQLARRCRASLRHAMLLSMFAAMAVLPMATISLPSLNLAIPVNAPAASASTLAFVLGTGSRTPAPNSATPTRAEGESSDGAAARRSALPVVSAVVALWLAGTSLLLASLTHAIHRVAQLRRTALPARDSASAEALASAGPQRPAYLVLTHESVTTPVTVGVIRHAIILPADASAWTADALQRALVHELEHIRRRDWATQIFARIVCALFWFNPLVWMAYRRLTLAAEHACDDAVVCRAEAQPATTTEEGTVYADQLVDLARRMNTRAHSAVLGMAQRSDLAARVHALLDRSTSRGRAGAGRLTVIGTVSFALLLLIAPLRFTQAPVSAEGVSTSAEQRQRRAPWRDRALVEAVDGGDIRDVRELLDDGANVDAAVDGDGSPLIVAAREGHLDIVRLLLDRGADVNLAVEGDGAPLIMAAREGHLEIAQLLLDRGANIELMVPGDENALIQASGAGELDVVKLLVSRGANVNARATVQRPYTLATTDAQGRRANYDMTKEEVRTPLNQALRGGHRAVADYLRSAGAVE
jgi:beta-lactamase regulating signal transducer with metallopeptidase domain